MSRRAHARDLRLVLGFVGQVRILHCFLLFGGYGSRWKRKQGDGRGSRERKQGEEARRESWKRKRGEEAEAGGGAKEEGNGW